MQHTEAAPVQPQRSSSGRAPIWPPPKFCPQHGSVLTGGPVVFTCSTGLCGGHSVVSADLPEAWG